MPVDQAQSVDGLTSPSSCWSATGRRPPALHGHAGDPTKEAMRASDVIAVDEAGRRYRVACIEARREGNRAGGGPGPRAGRYPREVRGAHGQRSGRWGTTACSGPWVFPIQLPRLAVYAGPAASRPLGPRAARAADAMRERPEEPCPFRTAFQRDRDRILHTKAFRRLKHKTQVFIAPDGRPLPHAAHPHARGVGHRRTVARALALNEDLVEAIAWATTWGTPRSATPARPPSTRS